MLVKENKTKDNYVFTFVVSKKEIAALQTLQKTLPLSEVIGASLLLKLLSVNLKVKK